MKLLITLDWTVKPARFVQPDEFRQFLDFAKRFCEYIPESKIWKIRPRDVIPMISYAKSIGWEVESIHKTDPESLQRQEDELIRRESTVRCTLREGRYSFQMERPSPLFHEIFHPKKSWLTGIVERVHHDNSYRTSSLPLAREIISVLLAQKFEVLKGDSFAAAEREYEEKEKAYANQDPAITPLLADGIKLFQHQNKAISYLDRTNGCALLGVCMGAGKTAISLCWAAKHNLRVAVVCPKTMRRTWIQEAGKFLGWEGAEIGSDVKTPQNLSEMRVVSTNYESIKKFGHLLEGFDVLVIDESHNCKSDRTIRTKLVTELAKKFRHRILLSGTAVKNKRSEIFSQLRILDSVTYAPERTGQHSQLATMPEGAFWESIQKLYLSMTKAEVLAFLPKKLVQRCDAPVDEPVGLPTCIEEMTIFKHNAALSKIEATCEKIQEILDGSEDSILVGSEFRDVCEAIAARFPSETIYHHGTMQNDAREAAKQEFQDGPKRIFVSTRSSLAVGATLTKASHVVFNDLPWSAADISQFEDRTHRIGQHKCVTVHWVVANNSEFDVRLVELISQKYELQKAVCEGKTLTVEEREFLAKPIGFKDLFKNRKKVDLDLDF